LRPFALPLCAQESTGGAAGSGAVGRFLAPATQVVAIRAGRLFDARSGRMLTGQTILIRGDKIAEVGANVNVPPEARVLDLGDATVLPGMIDVHVHVNVGGNEGARAPAERAYVALASAQTDLLAGFTTVADMDSRGGFNTVDLRDAINLGVVLGPRMQVVGQSLNIRASNAYPDSDSGRFYSEFTEGKNVNSPWLGRAAEREAKLHGVDWVKIYTSQDLEGPYHLYLPDGSLIRRRPPPRKSRRSRTRLTGSG
jgi:imidazolonepropionase-like amidohydrolase